MRKVVLVLAVALMAAACNLGAEGDGGTTGGPTTSPGNGSDALESREDRLPDNFPTDFPLPSGNRVLLSQFNDEGGLVFFQVGLSEAELIEFYTERLSAEGWLIVDCVATDDSPGPATVIFAQKGGRLTTTTIGELPTPNIDVSEWDFYVAVIPAEDRSTRDQTPAPCPR